MLVVLMFWTPARAADVDRFTEQWFLKTAAELDGSLRLQDELARLSLLPQLQTYHEATKAALMLTRELVQKRAEALRIVLPGHFPPDAIEQAEVAELRDLSAEARLRRVFGGALGNSMHWAETMRWAATSSSPEIRAIGAEVAPMFKEAANLGRVLGGLQPD